jgi:hypothetical protein
MAHRTSILVLGALTLAACNATPTAGAEPAPEGVTPVPVPSYLQHVETQPAEPTDDARMERRIPSPQEAFGTGSASDVSAVEPAARGANPAPSAPSAPEREARPFGPAAGAASGNAAAPAPSVTNDTGAPASSPPAPQTSLHPLTTAPAPRTSGSTGANGANTDPNGRAPRTSGSSGAR